MSGGRCRSRCLPPTNLTLTADPAQKMPDDAGDLNDECLGTRIRELPVIGAQMRSAIFSQTALPGATVR
jgi:hypothetical protein